MQKHKIIQTGVKVAIFMFPILKELVRSYLKNKSSGDTSNNRSNDNTEDSRKLYVPWPTTGSLKIETQKVQEVQ